MRDLNKKQKKELKTLAKDYYEAMNTHIYREDMSDSFIATIVAMNDHETIYWNIDRYLGDIRHEIGNGDIWDRR